MRALPTLLFLLPLLSPLALASPNPQEDLAKGLRGGRGRGSGKKAPPGGKSPPDGECADGLERCHRGCMPKGAVCCPERSGLYCKAGKYCDPGKSPKDDWWCMDHVPAEDFSHEEHEDVGDYSCIYAKRPGRIRGFA